MLQRASPASACRSCQTLGVMTPRTARIDSYFSLPTDLAAEMSLWPEYKWGEAYYVELKSHVELVTIRLVPATDDDDKHVLVEGTGSGPLFERALGCAVYALSAH
jgi:hypothetical protein